MRRKTVSKKTIEELEAEIAELKAQVKERDPYIQECLNSARETGEIFRTFSECSETDCSLAEFQHEVDDWLYDGMLESLLEFFYSVGKVRAMAGLQSQKEKS